jgi:hypothetical protein
VKEEMIAKILGFLHILGDAPMGTSKNFLQTAHPAAQNRQSL